MVINKAFFAWVTFALVCCAVVVFFVLQGKTSLKQMDLELAEIAAEEKAATRARAEKAKTEHTARVRQQRKEAQERRIALEAQSAQARKARAADLDAAATARNERLKEAEHQKCLAAFGEVKQQFLTNQSLLGVAAGPEASAELRLLAVYCATEAALTNKRGLLILFEKAEHAEKEEELRAELQEQQFEFDKLQAQVDMWTLAQVAQLKIEVQLACRYALQKKREAAAAAWAGRQVTRRPPRRRRSLESGRVDRLDRHKEPKL